MITPIPPHTWRKGYGVRRVEDDWAFALGVAIAEQAHWDAGRLVHEGYINGETGETYPDDQWPRTKAGDRKPVLGYYRHKRELDDLVAFERRCGRL